MFAVVRQGSCIRNDSFHLGSSSFEHKDRYFILALDDSIYDHVLNEPNHLTDKGLL
jgi:hypothetical protein